MRVTGLRHLDLAPHRNVRVLKEQLEASEARLQHAEARLAEQPALQLRVAELEAANAEWQEFYKVLLLLTPSLE
jgi:hypothetical protein